MGNKEYYQDVVEEIARCHLEIEQLRADLAKCEQEKQALYNTTSDDYGDKVKIIVDRDGWRTKAEKAEALAARYREELEMIEKLGQSTYHGYYLANIAKQVLSTPDE